MQSSLDLAQRGNPRSGEWWRLAARELWALWQSRPSLTKRAVLAVVWTHTPRRLKVAAAVVGALGLVFMTGALAVVVLLVETLLR